MFLESLERKFGAGRKMTTPWSEGWRNEQSVGTDQKLNRRHDKRVAVLGVPTNVLSSHAVFSPPDLYGNVVHSSSTVRCRVLRKAGRLAGARVF